MLTGVSSFLDPPSLEAIKRIGLMPLRPRYDVAPKVLKSKVAAPLKKMVVNYSLKVRAGADIEFDTLSSRPVWSL